MHSFYRLTFNLPHFFSARTLILWAALGAFVIGAPLAAVAAQHGEHESHRRTPSKPRSRKKTPARRVTRRATRPSQATDQQPRHTTQPEARPVDHTGHGTPSAQTRPSTTSSPSPVAPVPETTGGAIPAPSPEVKDAHDTHTPHASPVSLPQRDPVTRNAPPTEATFTPQDQAPGAHQGHPIEQPKETEPVDPPDPNAPTGHSRDDQKDAANAPGDHSSHSATAAAKANELMVMSGNQMSIRVGNNAANLLPMGRMGSGTAWQPATSPMHMWHASAGEWLLMYHGEAKIGVNHQGGPRGVTKFESQNWFMPMAYRRVGRGTLQLRGMFSVEPLTFSGAGSPQLFQTGEVYQGESIVDAQHPHDLFMELSAQYTVPIGERATWYAYLGFPGEPALGPVAFMHRTSASENPSAPLTHHLQDSTHIAFGVLTTGFTYRWLKLEGSVFNAREPDDQRYGFEFNPWNSRSFRLTVAPHDNWALQFSHGFLKNPELLEAGDTHRTTASVQYNKAFTRGNLAAALIWGRNREEHGDETFRLNGYTAEATLNFLDKNYLYTRLELVDKKDLLREEDLERLGFDHDFAHPQFRIGAYTLGAARDVWSNDKLSMALGGDVTFYSKPAALDALYGPRPTSYKFFIRLRPGRMKMSGQHGHGGHGN